MNSSQKQTRSRTGITISQVWLSKWLKIFRKRKAIILLKEICLINWARICKMKAEIDWNKIVWLNRYHVIVKRSRNCLKIAIMRIKERHQIKVKIVKVLIGFAEKQRKNQNKIRKFLIRLWIILKLFSNNFQRLHKIKKKYKRDIKNFGVGMEPKILILSF